MSRTGLNCSKQNCMFWEEMNLSLKYLSFGLIKSTDRYDVSQETAKIALNERLTKAMKGKDTYTIFSAISAPWDLLHLQKLCQDSALHAWRQGGLFEHHTDTGRCTKTTVSFQGQFFSYSFPSPASWGATETSYQW